MATSLFDTTTGQQPANANMYLGDMLTVTVVDTYSVLNGFQDGSLQFSNFINTSANGNYSVFAAPTGPTPLYYQAFTIQNTQIVYGATQYTQGSYPPYWAPVYQLVYTPSSIGTISAIYNQSVFEGSGEGGGNFYVVGVIGFQVIVTNAPQPSPPVIVQVSPMNVCPGSPVIVYGTSFDFTTMSVVVGSTPVSIIQGGSTLLNGVYVQTFSFTAPSLSANSYVLTIQQASGTITTGLTINSFPTVSNVNPTQVYPGNSFVISGNGFGSSGTVQMIDAFGTSILPIVSYSNTVITAQIPAGYNNGPTSNQIKVLGGCGSVTSPLYVYAPLPQPSPPPPPPPPPPPEVIVYTISISPTQTSLVANQNAKFCGATFSKWSCNTNCHCK